jgi:hypothetical protein
MKDLPLNTIGLALTNVPVIAANQMTAVDFRHNAKKMVFLSRDRGA